MLHAKLIAEIDYRKKQKDDMVFVSLDALACDFKMWLHNECGVQLKKDFRQTFTNNPVLEKVTAAGKNFGSFDLQFLLHQSVEFSSSFRHRSLDPTPYYIKPEDVVPPELKECKLRAGLDGEVAHRGLDDAWDIVNLLQRKFKQ